MTMPLAEFSLDEVFSPYVYVFYAAYLVAFVFTPLMKTVATHYGVIDQPDNARKLHKGPVAYLGGVAVFLGWMAGLAMSHFAKLHGTSGDAVARLVIPASIVPGAIVIVLLGLWDDIIKINPWLKIAGQVVAAVALLISGIGTHSMDPLLFPISHRLDVLLHLGTLPGWFQMTCGCAFTIGMTVFCCNATNLMDGLDGLCGGVTAIIAGGFLFLALHLGVLSSPDTTQIVALRIVLALALLGAVLGFVPFNFNPASIFMGDTGSMFLGYACALLIVLMAQVDTRWLLGSLIMFALPVLDTSLAFARRWINGRPVFSPDRFHFHHQLVARGLTVRKTVVFSYVLAVAFVLLGSAVVFMRTRYAGMIYVVIFCSIGVAAYKMGMIHERATVLEVKSGKGIEGGAVAAVNGGTVQGAVGNAVGGAAVAKAEAQSDPIA
jgi:UDP-GlcNAc:undecaprenyl-phosphate/decaprenyl-phosphate GlcNAc-1-phosphate transferase